MYEVPPYQVDPARLPPVLHTSEPGTFAHNTLAVRVPKIIEGTVAANQFEPGVRSALMELRDEILHGRIRPLREDVPDRPFWDAVGADCFGRTWLDVPWFWSETYFYRRMLEATRYFQPGPGRMVDPFAPIKHAEWQPDHAPRFASELLDGAKGDPPERFRYLLRGTLWSNRVDLSYRTVRADAARDGDYLLVDHTAAAWEYLSTIAGLTSS